MWLRGPAFLADQGYCSPCVAQQSVYLKFIVFYEAGFFGEMCLCSLFFQKKFPNALVTSISIEDEVLPRSKEKEIDSIYKLHLA